MMKLIHGDCRDYIDDVVKGEGNPVIVSDPPFNINYKYRTYKDNLNEDDYYSLIKRVFGTAPSVIIHYPEELYKISHVLNVFPEKVCSWVYNSNTAKQHRDVAFFGIRPDMNKVRQPYKNPNDKRIQEMIKNGSKGGRLYDWWNVNQVKNVSKVKCDHPCQMPIEVMCNIVGVLPDDCTIIDPFMGTGTTGLAVKEMNERQGACRNFVGIELDESYFEIAQGRIQGR